MITSAVIPLTSFDCPHILQHQHQKTTLKNQFAKWHSPCGKHPDFCNHMVNEASKPHTARLLHSSLIAMTTQVALTKISSNAKTGPIPTTTSERATCWEGCPFFAKGCYAKSGPQALHWRKVSEGARGVSWGEFTKLVRKMQRGQLWRHNVSGDLPHNGLGDIDADKMQQLSDANRGRKGYTYTHHPLTADNIQVLQDCNSKGFTINASTENVETADKVMTEHNIPAVAVVKSDETRRFFTTSSGRKVIVCPATIHENVTCATCGLCQQSDRSFVVAFPAHGNAKKTVNTLVA